MNVGGVVTAPPDSKRRPNLEGLPGSFTTARIQVGRMPSVFFYSFVFGVTTGANQ
jgi:hypothetical protein